jgi:DNA-binding transcriptional regulator YiaG
MEEKLLQKDVARHLGVTVDSVINWENNRTCPRAHSMPKIIKFLGYNPENFHDVALGD